MIISFKDRFVDKIKNGTKKHTIRGDKHDRWKGGTRMGMATGVRTTAYRKFAEKTCTGTQKISIKYFFSDNLIDCMNLKEKLGFLNYDLKEENYEQ
jgi:uncharacterized protein YqfB (UPF0267 family)